jgi:hypothetical protein
MAARATLPLLAPKKVNELCHIFESTGLVVVEGYFTESQTQAANELCDRWVAEFQQEYGYVPFKFPFLGLDPLFMDMMADPLVVAMGEHLCGDGVRFDHGFGVQQPGQIRMRDGSTLNQDADTGNLHGGPSSSQGALFVSYANSRMIVGQLNVGVVLTEQTPEGGGMCFVPGSHRHSSTLQGDDVLHQIYGGRFDHPSIVVPRLKVGDLVFFTETLYHGTTPWTGKGRPRRTLYFKYAPGFAAWRDPAALARYLPLARTELQRRLLRPPYVAQYEDEPTLSDHVGRSRTRGDKTALEVIKEHSANPIVTLGKIQRRLARGI